MKKILAILLAAMMAVSFAACNKEKNDEVNTDTTAKQEQVPERSHVLITMADGGEIKIELIPEYAPKTVENFLSLVKSGFYDGLTFHRVIEGFMIQGGDPEGTGLGGSGKYISGEFSLNGYNKNILKHSRGVVSMARSQHPDSASSQFFIMHQDNFNLDGQYAAFGKVISGMDVVDRIAAVETDENDKPINDVVIKSIKIIEE
ncbi:MAG: peptidylprolyl isomerase [Monoglobales bacterium]